MIDAFLIGAEELENLATRYLAAVLREHGFSVELAAFSSAQDMDAVLCQASRAQPRLVGLSIIFQYRTAEFMALAAGLRRVLPGAHITAGGHFPTFAAVELLRDFPVLDTVVCGEGELTLLELMERLDDGRTWPAIRGLALRDGDRIVENAPRPLIADLDSLPLPARDTWPQQHFGFGFSPILGSRGCSHNCAFCSIRSFYGRDGGQPQRFRSVKSLVDEMVMLRERFNVRFFVFNDDEWFPPGQRARLERVDALEAEVRARELDAIMSIKCRADDVEVDLFRRLLGLGVVRAYVGVESGSDRSLRTLNKRTTADQNRRALEALHQAGMLADFGLIFFDPDSTVDDVRANLDFLRDMGGTGLAPLSFGRMEVYAGTPIQARLLHEGRLTGNYLAWNYTIADSRVEMLWRLMIATMHHRQYDNRGSAKQCSIAYYELMMYKYLHADRYDPALGETLRQIVARVNNHSLALFEEMFDFTLHDDIRNVVRVNDLATDCATRINLFDLDVDAELAAWRNAVAERLWPGLNDAVHRRREEADATLG